METMMPTRATDENLLRRARAGDRPAYGELARRYRERLEALAGSLMSPALRRVVAVDDIVQESLARGLASIESFTWRGEGSLLRWLTVTPAGSGLYPLDGAIVPCRNSLSYNDRAELTILFQISRDICRPWRLMELEWKGHRCEATSRLRRS